MILLSNAVVGSTLATPTIPRRTLLVSSAAGSLVLLVGCTTNTNTPPGPSGSGTPSDDDAVRSQRVATETALIAAYDRVIGTQTSGVDGLRLFRAHHVAHLKALNPRTDPTGTASIAAPTSPSPRGTNDVAALAGLRKLESQAASSAVDLCVSAGNIELVEVLTQIGACEAAHAALLSGRGTPG